MLTIKAEIQRDKMRKDGTFNVKIRFTKGKRVKRISTDLFATLSDLDAKKMTLKEHSTVKDKADMLVYHFKSLYSELKLDYADCDLNDIVTRLLNKDLESKPIDFIGFSREWINTSAIRSKDIYTTALNSFIRFVGQDYFEINKVTVDLQEKYKDFITKERSKRVEKLIGENKRIPSYRCLSLYLTLIRHLFNEAQRHYNKPDVGLIRIPHSPFDYFRIPRQEATRKRAIQSQQIKAIWKLPYKNNVKGAKGTCRYDLAKDCFIMSFCLMGMNSVDLYNAKEFTDGRIIYNRTKTKERRLDSARMEVVVPKLILPLIKKYKDKTGQRLFNFHHYYADHKAFNKAINYGLKEIGSQLGIDDLEYYAARHSWATIALNKVGIDKYTVHAALNHVDESMRVTDIYIERDFVNENKANAKVVKYVFGR